MKKRVIWSFDKKPKKYLENIFKISCFVNINQWPPLQVAAAVAFLIARYFARERILRLVEGNKKFLAWPSTKRSGGMVLGL